MNILLVDDEPTVLSSMQRVLAHYAPKTWQVRCAGSGQSALDLLTAQRFDVIVSDMRMPEMDGAQFLGAAAAQWPDIARIVLSGQSDEATSMRAVAVAHQCLAKPYPTKSLFALLSRIGALRSSCENAAVRSAVGAARRLPVMPRVFEELGQILRIPEPDPWRIIELVGRHAGLAAKVLQLANSSFFAHGQRVTDVAEAVQRLGHRVIANIALVDGLTSSFKGVDPLDLAAETTRFFEASLIADAVVSPSERGDAALATLLCPVGKLLLLDEMPDMVEATRALAQREQLSLEDAEVHVFGASHAAIGGYLLAMWGLPAPVAEAVAAHHAPSTCAIQGEVLAAVHLASHHVEGTPLDRALLDKLAVGDLEARWARQHHATSR